MKTANLCSLNERAQQLVFSSISIALSSASSSKDVHKIHALIIASGLDQSVFFSGKLISKYALLKDPASSLSVFHRVSPTTNVYQWNSIIRALTQNGLFSTALDFYTRMQKMELVPDKFTFPSVINACAGLVDYEMGKFAHEHILKMGLQSDLYIGNALIDMYARFGYLAKALSVFEEMPQRDAVSWNSLISGYSSNGCWEEALEIYHLSRLVGLVPDFFTVSSVLPACGGLVAVKEGEVVHGLAMKTGINSYVVVGNGLLSMYFKFYRLMDARKIFYEMVVRDSVSWNTVICGLIQFNLFEDSAKIFVEMVNGFTPDLLTIVSVIRACGHLRDLEVGKFAHDLMVRIGYGCDITAGNILIDMYGKCGDLLAAREVFVRMEQKDSVSWNSLIRGYNKSGKFDEELKLFKMMKMDEKPDSITYVMLLSLSTQLAAANLGKEIHADITKLGFDSDLVVSNALVDMYAKCGEMSDSLKVFENMETRDIITWNTILAACVHSGDFQLGSRVIDRMRTVQIMPDMATMLGILPLCSLLAAKRQGKEIHGCILRLDFESYVPVGNALVEMYSRCGSLRNSIQVFKCMKSRDVVTWTTLISAYGMHGLGKKALEAFLEMETAGVVPDHVAFVALIYACSHSGLVEEGLAYFDRMKHYYNIEPRVQHYACVVDLLSRSGLITKAEKFILAMPLKPDVSIWGTLLSACRASRDTEIAERVSERIIELNSDDTGYSVLVSNVYAALGKWDRVRMIRKSIKARGLNKDLGCSWVEVRHRVYVFGAGDWSFGQFEEVKQLLAILADLMAREGYVIDLQHVPHYVEDNEKRSMLCEHSERLAIAFALLNTEAGSPLQVMKNLRVCVDCHTVTKYISKVVQREILMRDANRFHLFKDGTCSCGDLW